MIVPKPVILIESLLIISSKVLEIISAVICTRKVLRKNKIITG